MPEPEFSYLGALVLIQVGMVRKNVCPTCSVRRYVELVEGVCMRCKVDWGGALKRWEDREEFENGAFGHKNEHKELK